MHPEPHTDLDNLNTVQHNLRNSAKGSDNDYDVTVSLTESGWSCGGQDRGCALLKHLSIGQYFCGTHPCLLSVARE